ncbi:ABC transporter permease [Agromyces sp. NPDC004153]
MSAALWIAWVMFRRAMVVRVSGGIAAFGPPAVVLLLLLAPSTGAEGLSGAKIEAFGVERTWSSFIEASAQISSVALPLAGGILVAWWFGRELDDGLFPTLFARAVPRRSIAAARLVMVLAWGAIVTVLDLAATLGAGALLGLEGAAGLAPAAWTFTAVTLLTLAILPVIALATSAARSTTAGFGVLIGIVVVTQLGIAFGLDAWMPPAVSSLLAGIAGPDAAAAVAWPQVLLLLALGTACGVGTIAWWARARVR